MTKFGTRFIYKTDTWRAITVVSSISGWGPVAHLPAYAIIMVADVLAPNGRQAISNHYADSSIITEHHSGILSCNALQPSYKKWYQNVGRSATCLFLCFAFFTVITLYASDTGPLSILILSIIYHKRTAFLVIRHPPASLRHTTDSLINWWHCDYSLRRPLRTSLSRNN